MATTPLPLLFTFLIAALDCSSWSTRRNGAGEACMVCERKEFCFTREEAAAQFNISEKALHHSIHSSAEAYLVQVNHVRKTNNGRLEIELNTTINDVIKGSQQKGDRLVFWRLHDDLKGLEGWIKNLPGTSQYLFLTEMAPGQIGVDAQAPADMQEAKKGFGRLIAFHRKNCLPAAGR